jgi:hypothetical protein
MLGWNRLRERESSFDMLGFGKKRPVGTGPEVSTKYCTNTFSGKYPHVGLYDCRDGQVWVCKPLSGQAIRTSHARLITGCDNAMSTVWKDRFLCFWLYTPGTGQGQVLGQTLNWEEAHLLVRIDPHWDYDRQRLIPAELTSQIEQNLQRQLAHGQRILEFYREGELDYPLTLHFIGQRATDSYFAYKHIEPSR